MKTLETWEKATDAMAAQFISYVLAHNCTDKFRKYDCLEEIYKKHKDAK